MNAIKNALALCVVLVATSAPALAQSAAWAEAGLSANEVAQLNGMKILGNMAANALFQVGQLPNGQLVTIAPNGRLTVLPPGFNAKGLLAPNSGMGATANLAGGMLTPSTAALGNPGLVQPGVRSNQAVFPAYPLAASPHLMPLRTHTYARLMNTKKVLKKKLPAARVTVRAIR